RVAIDDYLLRVNLANSENVLIYSLDVSEDTLVVRLATANSVAGVVVDHDVGIKIFCNISQRRHSVEVVREVRAIGVRVDERVAGRLRRSTYQDASKVLLLAGFDRETFDVFRIEGLVAGMVEAEEPRLIERSLIGLLELGPLHDAVYRTLLVEEVLARGRPEGSL
ncbi:hypothetical protein PFISCL1PPCAC_16565, partial [Pristionchus fissidentatus]